MGQAITHRHPPVSLNDPDRQENYAHSQAEGSTGTVAKCKTLPRATIATGFHLRSSATPSGSITASVSVDEQEQPSLGLAAGHGDVRTTRRVVVPAHPSQGLTRADRIPVEAGAGPCADQFL